MSICYSLKIITFRQTLSVAFEISRKTPVTFNSSSKDFYISLVIDKSWLTQESSGLKPDWFDQIKLSSIRNLKISLNISLLSTFPKIGNN